MPMHSRTTFHGLLIQTHLVLLHSHCERQLGAKQSQRARLRLLRHFVPRNGTSLNAFALAAFLLLGLATGIFGADVRQELRQNFATPPDSARPWVYWFWLNGNITREGISADLEAMKRVGIGGVLIMEVDQGAPLGQVPFAGPKWRELFKHVTAEANRLGLEVRMNNDAGWCGSGGPWITPELSMQKVVWTETQVQGPTHFEGTLIQPPAVANFYRDIVVWAFPTPAGNANIGGFREKAGFVPLDAAPATHAVWPEVPREQTIPRRRLIDLTARLDRNGRVTWDVPAGRWTILRLGHTSTGKDNHPAPLSGRGLECDKLSQTAAETQFEGLMGKLIADAGPLAGKVLSSTHIDSWEIGMQNWTPKFREEFQRRRGYDPLPFLPAMTGRIVDGREVSERFLWDLRQTISDLMLENYAGHMRELAHRRGLQLSIEAYSNCPADEMAYAGQADEPMAEFWFWNKNWSAFSCTEMASAAHVFGKPILGAEAFTATDAERWLGHPALLKELGDWAFCEGINRFVIHRYAMQPWLNVRPGMSMGPWGQHYERTQTWWEQSVAWHRYLARCQYLLRQGLFAADVCYLGPEGSPQTLSGQRAFLSDVPGEEYLPRERPGYNFDTCPPEVVLKQMTVKDGRLALAGGMSYRLLVLPMVETMTPELLAKIKELVEAGATVVGSRPSKSPSLVGYPASDGKVRRLAAQLWGPGAPPAQLTERRVGKGRIFWSSAFQKKPELVRAPADKLDSARWIWYPEGNPTEAAPLGKRFFRRTFDVHAGGTVQSASLVMTADNTFVCWVNGQKAQAGSDAGREFETDPTRLLKPGANILAVEAENGTNWPSPAGLIGALTIRYRGGRVSTITTDKTWQAAQTIKDGWVSEAAPGEGWTSAKELGPFGISPWGAIGPSLFDMEIYVRPELVASVMEKLGVPPDFSFRTESGAASLRYIHRTADGADIYFVANKLPQSERAVCTFRVQDKRPEFWRPDSGRIERPAVYDAAGDSVRVPISFEPYGSVFVIFAEDKSAADRIVSVAGNGKEMLTTASATASVRGGKDGAPLPVESPVIALTESPDKRYEAEIWQPGAYTMKSADGKTRQVEASVIPQPVMIDGPWEVRFAPGGGAPRRITLDKLASWSENPDRGVKYYSGAATYTKTFSVSPDIIGKDRGVWLDLCQVEVMAEVNLNGQNLGILWKPPYRLDITGAAKPGANKLEVTVVNLLVNRQIGDEFLPEDSDRNPDGTLKAWPKWVLEGKKSPTGRVSFTSWRLWHKTDALLESGLLGPVQLVPTVRRVVPR
jgi:hypothetical protein